MKGRKPADKQWRTPEAAESSDSSPEVEFGNSAWSKCDSDESQDLSMDNTPSAWRKKGSPMVVIKPLACGANLETEAGKQDVDLGSSQEFSLQTSTSPEAMDWRETTSSAKSQVVTVADECTQVSLTSSGSWSDQDSPTFDMVLPSGKKRRRWQEDEVLDTLPCSG